MSESLAGSVAIVTGASSGIGRATAIALGEAGAAVAVAARRADRLDEVVARIRRDGGRALAVATDVADREAVFALVERAAAEFGPADLLVNNAGIMPTSPVREIHLDDWLRMVDVNVKGVLHCIAAALPAMLERRRGHIVNVGSLAGRRPLPGRHRIRGHQVRGALHLGRHAAGVVGGARNPDHRHSARRGRHRAGGAHPGPGNPGGVHRALAGQEAHGRGGRGRGHPLRRYGSRARQHQRDPDAPRATSRPDGAAEEKGAQAPQTENGPACRKGSPATGRAPGYRKGPPATARRSRTRARTGCPRPSRSRSGSRRWCCRSPDPRRR